MAKIEVKDWKQKSDEEKAIFKAICEKKNLLGEGDIIVDGTETKNPFCKIACNAAYAVAIAACAGNPICIAAATIVRDECLDEC